MLVLFKIRNIIWHDVYTEFHQNKFSTSIKNLFSSSQRPDPLWRPPSLLSNEYRGFSRGYSSRSVKLTIHLHLVPRSRTLELCLRSPIRLHGVELIYLVKHRDNFTFYQHY
jgi:hypothetical protein